MATWRPGTEEEEEEEEAEEEELAKRRNVLVLTFRLDRNRSHGGRLVGTFAVTLRPAQERKRCNMGWCPLKSRHTDSRSSSP